MTMKSKDPILPTRVSLHSECARVLKSRIESGEWSGVLPGERRLAEVLNVGRDTIRMALSELAAEGWIDSGVSGKRRMILKHHPALKTVSRKAWRIGMLSPFTLEHLSQSMLAEVDRVRSILARRGGVLELLSPPWYDAPLASRKMHALIESDPHDAWILYRSQRQIQEFFQTERIPCLIRGYPHEGIDLPHMDYDWAAIGRHAVGELWRKGHRHIALLMPTDGMRGNTAAWQGVRSFKEEGVVLTDVWEGGDTESLGNAVAACLKSPSPPTAFIALRTRQTVTLLTWLGSKGFRVPRDFSLISLPTEPSMSHLVPSISTYQMDPSFFARRVVRQIELLVGGGSGLQGSLLVMPEYVAGGSVAAR